MSSHHVRRVHRMRHHDYPGTALSAAPALSEHGEFMAAVLVAANAELTMGRS